jgi:hypothetical protein
MKSNFEATCGETLNPSYTFTGLTSKIVLSPDLTISWNAGVFTSNGIYTVTVVGHLSGPHTMTITKIVTINI